MLAIASEFAGRTSTILLGSALFLVACLATSTGTAVFAHVLQHGWQSPDCLGWSGFLFFVGIISCVACLGGLVPLLRLLWVFHKRKNLLLLAALLGTMWGILFIAVSYCFVHDNYHRMFPAWPIAQTGISAISCWALGRRLSKSLSAMSPPPGG